MAIDYSFEMGRPSTVGDVAGVFSHAAVAPRLTEGDPADFHQGVELRGGTLVQVTASPSLPFPDPVEERFGFGPAVHVLFRFDKITSSAVQRRDMVGLVVAALEKVAGDALLTFSGEIVWLLRRGTRLTVRADGDF